VAQRLVRTLCANCKTEVDFDKNEIPEKYRKAVTEKQFKAKGCESCYYTGYKGRRAIYEVINITKELSEQIKQNATNIDNYLQENKIDTLAQNALKMFVNGQSSLDEIYPYLITEN
jgi:type II secretory ATPase GspE/PulE/Tfp pilus assembly ATPase PilB-like protein